MKITINVPRAKRRCPMAVAMNKRHARSHVMRDRRKRRANDARNDWRNDWESAGENIDLSAFGL
jgi:hypothetical protein